MPTHDWTPLHDQYANGLDQSLETIETGLAGADLKTLHTYASVFLWLWTVYAFLGKALSEHDQKALGGRIVRAYAQVYAKLAILSSPFI